MKIRGFNYPLQRLFKLELIVFAELNLEFERQNAGDLRPCEAKETCDERKECSR